MWFKLLYFTILLYSILGKEVFNNALIDSQIIDPNNYFPGTRQNGRTIYHHNRHLEQVVHKQPKQQISKSNQTKSNHSATLPPETQIQKPTLPPVNQTIDHSNQTLKNSKTTEKTFPQQSKIPQSQLLPQDEEQFEQSHEFNHLSQQQLNATFGGISKQLLSILNPSDQDDIDNDLVAKLIAKLGLVDSKQIKQQYDVTKKGQQIKKQERSWFNSKLDEWVLEQKKSSQSLKERMHISGQIFQRFQFQLKPDQKRKFYMKIDPQRPDTFTFHITLYWLVQDNYLPPIQPSKQSHLSINIANSSTSLKQTIYIQKVFQWTQRHQQNNVQITFTNNVPHTIMVLLNLEKIKYIPLNSPKNQHIQPIVSKLVNIINDDKKNHTQNFYRGKSSYFYKQNQQSHMSKYLLLQTIQAIVIVISSLVQIFYLRKLLGNNVIMV